MKTSVHLQKMLSYQSWPIIVTAIVLGILTALLIVFIILKVKRLIKANRKPTIKAIIKPKPNMEQLKREYLKKLFKLESRFELEGNNADIRSTYQEMSEIIRTFVYEATDVEVHKYTLEDIKKTEKMHNLAELVEEYYKPEFEKVSIGDVKSSINKTKKAIEGWN